MSNGNEKKRNFGLLHINQTFTHKKVVNTLRRFRRDVEENKIQRPLRLSLKKVMVPELKNKAKELGLIFKRKYIGSAGAVDIKGSKKAAGVGFTAKYAMNLEEGSETEIVSVSRIQEWLKKKGLPSDIVTAIRVTRKLKRDGLEPRKTVQQTWEEQKDKLFKEFISRYGKAIGLNRKKI